MAQDIVEVMARGIAECDGCEDWERLPEDSQAAGMLTKEGYLASSRAALAALEQAGYAVVPVVPTEAMIDAGAVAEGDGNLATEARNLWTAMLSAYKQAP